MIEQINQIARMWWGWMWPMFWQAGVVVVLVWAADLIIRRRVWPQVRYALWVLVLLKLVLPPWLAAPTSVTSQLEPFATEAVKYSFFTDESAVGPPSRQPGPAVTTEVETLIVRPPVTTDVPLAVRPQVPARDTAGAADSFDASQLAEEKGPRPGWKSWAMLVWLMGVVTLSVWLMLRFRQLRRRHLAKKGRSDLPGGLEQVLAEAAKKLKLRRVPEVVLSREVVSPAVFGVFRPVLLMPAGEVNRLCRRELEHVLLHELAHIKRGDLKVQAFYMVLQIVYWFNPLLWLVRRQLQHLRELCCDATVARVLREETTGYRETILQTARRLLTRPVEPGMGLLGLFEDSTRLMTRLKWLEKKTWRHRGLRIATIFFIVAAMCACVLPMARHKRPDRDLLIKFTEDEKGPPQRIKSRNKTTWIKRYDVEFAPGEELLVVAELYQAGKRMRQLGQMIFGGSGEPQELSFTFVRAYKNQAKTVVAHSAKIKLGEQALEIPPLTVETRRYSAGEGWDWYSGEGLRVLKQQHTQKDYAELETLFHYHDGGGQVEEGEARFWIPGVSRSPIASQHQIAFKMIPVSRVDYLYLEPVAGLQGLDGQIMPTALAAHKAAAAEYKQMIVEAVENEKSGDEFKAAAANGLPVELVGVRPDGGDEIYDANGRRIAEDTFANIDARWRKDSQYRTFIFELPVPDEQLLFTPFLEIRPAGGEHGLGTGQRHLVYSSDDKLTYSVGASFARRYKKWFTRRIKEVDLRLRYYRGGRGKADFVFKGPFTAGQTVKAQGGADCQLTTKEDRLNFSNHPAAFFGVSSKTRFDGKSVLVYDTWGRRHLPEGERGHNGKDGSSHSYRVEGLALDSIAYVTVGEKPFERTFEKVVVSYRGRPARERMEYLDRMSERLGLSGLTDEQLYKYKFENPAEAIKVIDIVRGQLHVRKAFEAIVYAEPRLDISTPDEASRQKVRSAAKRWAAAGDPRIRAAGIRLGLYAGWSEFLDLALTALESEERIWEMIGPGYGYGQKQARVEIADGVGRYAGAIQSKQADRIREIILRTPDARIRERLFMLFWRADTNTTYEVCLPLASDERAWIWWPAISTLLNRCTERLRPFGSLSDEMLKRLILVEGERPPSSPLFRVSSSGKDYATLAGEAYSMLPGLFTPKLAQMSGSLCHDVQKRLAAHLERDQAEEVMIEFLRGILTGPMQRLWAEDDTFFNNCCAESFYIARQFNRWYGLNIGSVGTTYEEHGERIPIHIADLKALIAETLQWYDGRKGGGEFSAVVGGLRCEAELVKRKLAFGEQPQLVVGLTNTTEEPIDVIGNWYPTRPNPVYRYRTPCTQLKISGDGLSGGYRIQSYGSSRAMPDAVRIEPGQRWSFEIPPPRGEDRTAKEKDSLPSLSALVPGRYTAEVTYSIGKGEKERFEPGLVFGSEMGPLAGKKPEHLWGGVIHSNTLTFEVLEDDSEELRIRRASDSGEGIREYLRLELTASKSKVNAGGTVNLSLAATNTGPEPLYLGNYHGLHERGPRGDRQHLGGPRSGTPLAVESGSTVGMGTWGFGSGEPLVPGKYEVWAEYLSYKAPRQVLARSNTVTIEVLAVSPQAEYSAALADGTTVELIGLCEHPSKGRQWWRPDGTLLAEAPYDQVYTTVPPAKADEQAYEIAIGMSQVPDSFWLSASGEVIDHPGYAVGHPKKDGAELRDIHVSLRYMRAVQTATRIRLGPFNGCSVTFKNVSLRPGVKTNAEVDVEERATGLSLRQEVEVEPSGGEMTGGTAQDFASRAAEAMNAGDFERSQALFAEAGKLDPNIAEAWAGRGLEKYPDGKSVAGARMVIICNKKAFENNEPVRFHVRLRNDGNKELVAAPCEIGFIAVVDGEEYVHDYRSRMDACHRVRLATGEEHTVSVSVENYEWLRVKNDSEFLEMSPGEHTVQLKMEPEPSSEMKGTVYSDVLTITVAEPQEGFGEVQVEAGRISWGEVADGLQLGVGFADEDEVYGLGDVVRLGVYVRNVADNEAVLIYYVRGGSKSLEGSFTGPNLRDSRGQDVALRSPISGGGIFVESRRVLVRPGEIKLLGEERLGMGAHIEGGPVDYSAAVEPGRYRLQQKVRLGLAKRDTWVELTSGQLALTVKSERIWQIAWGQVVEGLRVCISVEKNEFGLGEPIVVRWRIGNICDQDKTIIWHERHYSPVVFEIGKKGEQKYIVEDSRRMYNVAIPAPPTKTILSPGDVKEATFDVRYFLMWWNTEKDVGVYEVTGLYSPKDSRQLADHWLAKPEFEDVVTDRIESGTMEITLTKNLDWLKQQLAGGEFWDRLQAGHRLAPLIGNEKVLAELEKMYPPQNTRHMVHLVGLMASLGDRSHVKEVMDMYEAGGYAPYMQDYYDDMIDFIGRWGGGVARSPMDDTRVRYRKIDFMHAGGVSDGLELVVKPAKESFAADEDIVLDFYMHNERPPHKLFCIYPDTQWQWTSWSIQDGRGARLEMPQRQIEGSLRPVRKDDFFVIAPKKTIYWQRIIRKEWLPGGGLVPGAYMLFVSMNRAAEMKSVLADYEQFCRSHYIEPWQGTPETGPIPLRIVAGGAGTSTEAGQ